MTWQDMFDLLRLKVDDVAGDIFTNTKCAQIFNSSMRHIHNELITRGIYTVRFDAAATFSPGNQEVTPVRTNPNKSIQKIIRAERSDNSPIDVLDEAISKKSDTESIYINGSKIGWYRSVTSMFTIDFRYIAPPSVLVDLSSTGLDEVPEEVPEAFHDSIVLWAVVLSLGIDEHAINSWTGIYQTEIALALQSADPRPDEGQRVTDVYLDAADD